MLGGDAVLERETGVRGRIRGDHAHNVFGWVGLSSLANYIFI